MCTSDDSAASQGRYQHTAFSKRAFPRIYLKPIDKCPAHGVREDIIYVSQSQKGTTLDDADRPMRMNARQAFRDGNSCRTRTHDNDIEALICQFVE
jgi:hypothetical protein